MNRLEDAARRLGRAHQAHLRRPDCHKTYVAYLEALAAYRAVRITVLEQVVFAAGIDVREAINGAAA